MDVAIEFAVEVAVDFDVAVALNVEAFSLWHNNHLQSGKGKKGYKKNRLGTCSGRLN